MARCSLVPARPGAQALGAPQARLVLKAALARRARGLGGLTRVRGRECAADEVAEPLLRLAVALRLRFLQSAAWSRPLGPRGSVSGRERAGRRGSRRSSCCGTGIVTPWARKTRQIAGFTSERALLTPFPGSAVQKRTSSSMP